MIRGDCGSRASDFSSASMFGHGTNHDLSGELEAVCDSLLLRFSSTKFNVSADCIGSTGSSGCVEAAGWRFGAFGECTSAGNRFGDELRGGWLECGHPFGGHPLREL